MIKKLVLALALTLFPLGSSLAQLESQTNSERFNDSNLISAETGVDYTQLRDYLKAEKWRKANDETGDLLLEATGRRLQGWVTEEKMKQFPCADLKIIDNLWREYSNGHFGWSIQFPIFIATGNRPGRLVDDEAYREFGDRVGWRKDGDWIVFKENLGYDLSSPPGHLPKPMSQYDLTGSRRQYVIFTKRMQECSLVNSTTPEL